MEKRDPQQQMNRFIDWMLDQLGDAGKLDTAAATYNEAAKVDKVRHARRSIATTPADREAVLPYLRGMNSKPLTNIWVRPSAELVAHPLVMLDDLPIPRALAVCKKYGGAAVQTSPDLAQAWIVLSRPLDREQRQTVAAALCRLIGSDPDAVSEPRWGRLPGYQQRKPGKSGWTNLLTISDAPALDPTPYLAELPQPPKAATLPPTGAGGPSPLPAPPSATGRDESKAEFLFALCSLRAGVSIEETAARISARALDRRKRPDQAQADRYGLKTARNAAASLGMKL